MNAKPESQPTPSAFDEAIRYIREKLDEPRRPVIYLPSPDGLNSVIGDNFRRDGFEVRYLKDYGSPRTASPSGFLARVSEALREAPHWEPKSPAESGTHAPSEDQAPGAKATPPAGTSAGDPSQTIGMSQEAERIGELQPCISSGITLHIGTLNINL